MATAAIPSSTGPMPTTLKAPATSSTTPELATADRGLNQVPSRAAPPQLSNRRIARAAPSDFLSDQATTALIRRILCAQNSADRSRSDPAPIEELLPPLTSRNDVDLQLYALISIILREFVQNWYSKITPDQTFVAEIVQIIAHCTRALEQRLRNVDLESLLLDELPELLDAHVQAYRIAQKSAARPPLEVNKRDIYHSLCPLPALSPVPKPEDAKSVQAQVNNEIAYRQLLVQGVLALLLPTEDLENDCLTSLVGQIFSELIVGNQVANKISEPWLLLELIIILTRLVGRKRASSPEIDDSNGPNPRDDLHSRDMTKVQAARSRRGWSIDQIFWSIIQWGFNLVNIMRLITTTIVLSPSVPPRAAPVSARRLESTSHYGSEKSYNPPAGFKDPSAPVKVPVLDFKIWPCIANLLEMDARMPWLAGAFSIVQWGAMRGPGRVAAYNGIVDRLLSHNIQTSLLDSSLLSPLLRAIRAALFPNNAPGSSSLVAPSSDEELTALRRRCASSIWALVPKGVGRLYFGSGGFFWASSSANHQPSGTSLLSADTRTEIKSRGNANAQRYGPLENSDRGSGSSNYSAAHKTIDADAQGMNVGGSERLPQLGNPSSDDATSSKSAKRGPSTRSPEAVESTSAAEESSPLLHDTGIDDDRWENKEEERILSEIETGILDIFSDPYCNKHLMYGVLELVLVRLMPELSEKGIIELWEERLS